MPLGIDKNSEPVNIAGGVSNPLAKTAQAEPPATTATTPIKVPTRRDASPVTLLATVEHMTATRQRFRMRRTQMRERKAASKDLPATAPGVRPGDFPVGSMQSRAAARTMLDYLEENREVPVMVVERWPRYSRTVEDPGGGYKRVVEKPPDGGERPIGQAVFEGETFEVYGSLDNPNLYLKVGTEPLPEVRLPRATIICEVLGYEGTNGP